MTNVAQKTSERPSETRVRTSPRAKRLAPNRAERVRALLDEAMMLCPMEPGYWQELRIALGTIEHLHDLVTDVARERVEVNVSPMLAALALCEAHDTAHAIMLRAVASARTASADLSAAAAE